VSARRRQAGTAIPGDFTFRPDMGNYVGNTEQRRTFFIVWKIKLLLPFLSFPRRLSGSGASEHFNELVLEF